MPQTFESPIFVHCNPLYEPNDFEISAYIVDEAQVHVPCVSSIESPTISLGHFDMPLTTPTHAHVDACDTLPPVGHIMTYGNLCHEIPTDCLSFPFACFFFGISSHNDKSTFYALYILVYFLFLHHSICHILILAFVGSEFDKLLQSLSNYLLNKI